MKTYVKPQIVGHHGIQFVASISSGWHQGTIQNGLVPWTSDDPNTTTEWLPPGETPWHPY